MTDDFTFDLDTDGDGYGDAAYVDANSDGVYDTIVYDTNGDGLIDAMRNDADGDGSYETVVRDLDGDGRFETAATDTDRDGYAETVLSDTDGDGRFESMAVDTDHDGTTDQVLPAPATSVADGTPPSTSSGAGSSGYPAPGSYAATHPAAQADFQNDAINTQGTVTRAPLQPSGVTSSYDSSANSEVFTARDGRTYDNPYDARDHNNGY